MQLNKVVHLLDIFNYSSVTDTQPKISNILPEAPKVIENFTLAAIFARIAEASVDFLFTHFSVEAWLTVAAKLVECQQHTRATILTRQLVTHITLGQD